MTLASVAILFIIAYVLVGVCTYVSGAAFDCSAYNAIAGWPGVWAAWFMHVMGR